MEFVVADTCIGGDLLRNRNLHIEGAEQYRAADYAQRAVRDLEQPLGLTPFIPRDAKERLSPFHRLSTLIGCGIPGADFIWRRARDRTTRVGVWIKPLFLSCMQ